MEECVLSVRTAAVWTTVGNRNAAASGGRAKRLPALATAIVATVRCMVPDHATPAAARATKDPRIAATPSMEVMGVHAEKKPFCVPNMGWIYNTQPYSDVDSPNRPDGEILRSDSYDRHIGDLGDHAWRGRRRATHH